MLHWTEIFTIIFIVIVLISVSAYLIKQRKSGKVGCSVNCGHCPTKQIDIVAYYRKHYK
ncbi:MAG: hypothetical protein BWY30_00893 [Tenericutes bacterium ADurb.Bin239]|nr:MAG: hypothetical protein BWY30_00893 [Tenericutes bacterium ADurb.Bin239]